MVFWSIGGRWTRRGGMTKKRLLTALSISALLFAACGNDEPEITGQDVAESAQETAEDAADRAGELAEQGGDAVEDATDNLGDDSDDADQSGVEMRITDTTVEGNDAVLTMEVSGIEIVPADGDTSGRTGHFHVFVDTPPVEEGVVIAQGTGVAHSATNPIRFPDLPPGEHTLTVVLGDGNHARILPGVEAKTTVTIE